MPTIGAECHELRINDKNQTWGILYQLAQDAVVILDVFSKQTATTPAETLAIYHKRLSMYLRAASDKERDRS